MTLCIYSAKAKEAIKLKDKGVEISIGDDSVINITRDDDKEVEFNNLYNKRQIDEMDFGEYKLDEFYKKEIYPDGTINKFKTDGTILPASAKSLQNLYLNLRESVSNLSKYLKNLEVGKIAPEEYLPIFDSFDKTDPSNYYTTNNYDVSSYSNLIKALKQNQIILSSIINHLYGAVSDIPEFSISEFLQEKLTPQKNIIQINKSVSDPPEYITAQKTIEKYGQLVELIEIECENLVDILLIESDEKLKVIEKYQEEVKDEPLDLSEDNKKYITKWRTKDEFANTFSSLIEKISISNQAISDWISNLEQIKTTGIDFSKVGSLKIIENKILKDTQITSLNNLISNLNTNNDNISKWIKDDTINFSELNDLNVVNKTENSYNATTEKVSNFEDYFNKTNSTNKNISDWLEKLNEESIDLFDNLNSDNLMCLINETTNKPEIKKVKIELVEDGAEPEDNFQLVDPNNINYKIPTKQEFEQLKPQLQTEFEFGFLSEPIILRLKKSWIKTKEGIKTVKNAVLNSLYLVSILPITLFTERESKVNYFIKSLYNFLYYIWNNYLAKIVFPIYDELSQTLTYAKIEKYIFSEEDQQPTNLDTPILNLRNWLPDAYEKIKAGTNIITYYYSDFKSFVNNYWHSFTDWLSIKNHNFWHALDKFIDNHTILFSCLVMSWCPILIIYNIYPDYRFDKMMREEYGPHAQILNDEIANIEGTEVVVDSKMQEQLKYSLNLIEIINNLCQAHNDVMDKIENLPSSSGESNFEKKEGFPKYYVKNEDVKPTTDSASNILAIDLENDIKNQIIKSSNKVEVFKFILRKNIIFTEDGTLIKEFIAYAQNNKIYNPVITSQDNSVCEISFIEGEDFYISFDSKLSFNPYELYMNGELSIMYLLSQDYVEAKTPTIKCEVIEAKNAFKLHESDVYYFYKPSIITQESFTSGFNSYDCYKMVYKIKDDYVIPDGLNFVFNEYCFGNSWSLTWNGNYWEGDNIKGRCNGKVISLLQRMEGKNPFNAHGCYIMCKKNEWNTKLIYHDNDEGLMKNLWYRSNRIISVKLKDGTVKSSHDYSLQLDWYPATGQSYEGYDLLLINCLIANYNGNNFPNDNVEKIYCDIYAQKPNWTNNECTDVATRLVFNVGSIHHDSQNNLAYVDITGELDTIEKINFRISNRRNYYAEDHMTPIYKRDLELYLRKDFTDVVDEVNWDPSTNPFEYIIQQQFYDISPNPNAATTLYTDFNITSSKIITADNITTMRSDLNLITNNVDIMSYDVKEISERVNNLNASLVEQKEKTKYLKTKTDQIEITADVALAFGITGTILGGVGTGLGLYNMGIKFPTKIINGNETISNQLSGLLSDIESDVESDFGSNLIDTITDPNELPDIEFDPYMRSKTTTDLTPILDWCNKDGGKLKTVQFSHELDNPNHLGLSVSGGLEICNKFRNSLKPTFKALTNRINEINAEFEGLNNYISKDELVRDDKIDIIAKYSGNNFYLEAEDNITNGLITFRLCYELETDRKVCSLVLKIIDGQINLFKSVEEQVIEHDPVFDKDIEINGLRGSDYFKNEYISEYYTFDGKIFTAKINSSFVKILNVILDLNTSGRHLAYKVSDFAYVQDLDIIEQKIKQLQENSSSTENIYNRINNCISKDELVRKDYIDVIAKVENQLITLKLEDDYESDGLIVFRIFRVNSNNQVQRRFYIKIVDHQITEYFGVDNEIEIDGVIIQPLAKSEEARISYMPEAVLNDKTITITITDSNIKISGCVIDKCTLGRDLTFTIKDLAYTCDIEALDQKICAVAEQSHMNDVNNFATVDEVNDVLVNNYRLKDDIKFGTTTKNLEFEMKIWALTNQFINGARIKGVYTAPTSGEFDFIFIDEKGDSEKDEHECWFGDNREHYSSWNFVDGKYRLIIKPNNSIKKFNIKSITYEGPDEFALKSENEELKNKITALENENAALKSQITELQFTAIYSDYIKCSTSFADKLFELGGIYYEIKETNTNKLVILNEAEIYKLLFIIKDTTNKKHYIEYRQPENLFILDRIYGSEFVRYGTYNSDSCEATFNVDFSVNASYENLEYVDEIYYHYTSPQQ